MHTHPGVCVSFFPPAPAMEPARPTDELRPIFGLVCGNSRRRLAISAATSRFIPCLPGLRTRFCAYLAHTQAYLLYTIAARNATKKPLRA